MSDPITYDEAVAAVRKATLEAISKHRILFTIQAILMVVAGVVALVFPLFTTLAVTLVLGWILIANGIVHLISLLAAARSPGFWLSLISAALSVVVGVLLIRNPGLALGALVLLLIVYFMVEGTAKVALSLTVRPLPNWGLVLLSGILGVAIGLYLLFNPAVSLWLIGFLVGFHLVAEGAALVMMVIQSRK
ncbi:HdeD family acid-resistance protein [Palleronia sp. KMU-117]|uniref:HdeD family acid-resistance protein n=1 Tax=Palleronia sp. KMU-117 TaxID=3434108 RepID=UPI003D71F422